MNNKVAEYNKHLMKRWNTEALNMMQWTVKEMTPSHDTLKIIVTALGGLSSFVGFITIYF
jgi:hypothetical protein